MARIGWLSSVALLFTACFSPTYPEGIACGPDESCPAGTTCVDNVCLSPDDLLADAKSTPPDGPENQPDAPSQDAPAPAPDAMPDAAPDAPPDAPPPGYCDDDGDCATPPNLCFLAGTCDLDTHRCTFPPKDCSNLDSACMRGVCRMSDGACLGEPINDGMTCAATSCGSFGSCEYGGGVCDESGEKARTCTDFTCQAGTCTGQDRIDTQSCSRDTEDNTCGFQQPSNCGPCFENGEGVCVKSCTCATKTCHQGSCETDTFGCTRPCLDQATTSGAPVCPL